MKLEIRNNILELEGYINVTERPSEILSDKNGKFIEVIKRGCWNRALNSGRTIDLLYNHNPERKLGDSKTNLELIEDSIGLKFRATIDDPNIIQKARSGKLKNCSFGFLPKRMSKEVIGGIEHRNLHEIDLYEVSLLDILPAYSGCSIYQRDLNGTDEQYLVRSTPLDLQKLKELEEQDLQQDINEEKIEGKLENKSDALIEHEIEEEKLDAEEDVIENKFDNELLKLWLWLQQQKN